MAVIGIKSSSITEGTSHVHDSEYSRWKVMSEGGTTYLTTDTIDPSDTDAEIVSPGIAGSLVNGQKIMVGFNTTLAGSGSVEPDFHVDGSIDGKNWTLVGSQLDADTEVDTTGVQLHALDLSTYQLPWYRLAFNAGNDDITTWQGVFFVGGLADGGNEGSVGVVGVGPDPS